MGDILSFLLTVSAVQLRHWVMREHLDTHAAVLFHSSTSVRQGQRRFLYASSTLQTPQFNSFPGLSEPVYESHVGFSNVTHSSCARADDCISEAYFTPKGLIFTNTV